MVLENPRKMSRNTLVRKEKVVEGEVMRLMKQWSDLRDAKEDRLERVDEEEY